jgi:hypothetical protein
VHATTKNSINAIDEHLIIPIHPSSIEHWGRYKQGICRKADVVILAISSTRIATCRRRVPLM